MKTGRRFAKRRAQRPGNWTISVGITGRVQPERVDGLGGIRKVRVGGE